MRTCPRCKKEYSEFPALSRVDNKTDICSDCGVREAMADYFGIPLSKVTEPVKEYEQEKV
jgi:transcription elongation factor Elf1